MGTRMSSSEERGVLEGRHRRQRKEGHFLCESEGSVAPKILSSEERGMSEGRHRRQKKEGHFLCESEESVAPKFLSRTSFRPVLDL